MSGDAREFLRDLFRREHKIHAARRDRTARHRIMFSRIVLRESHAAFRFDRFEPDRPVRRRTGKYDADGPFPLVLRERFEKEINRPLRPASLTSRGKLQHAPGDGHVPVGRNDINMIGLDAQILRYLAHRLVAARPSNWASALSCCGSRCCTRTKLIPVSAGRCLSSCVNASSPPADAPIPTMGNESSGPFGGFRAEELERRFRFRAGERRRAISLREDLSTAALAEGALRFRFGGTFSWGRFIGRITPAKSTAP